MSDNSFVNPLPRATPKSVFVTGANGYIGLAVCRAFVRAGWRVYGFIRRPEVAEELVRAEVRPVVGTLTNLDFLPELYKQTQTFDVIVNATETFPGYTEHFNQALSLVLDLAATSNRNGVRPLVLWSSGCKDYGSGDLHGSPGLQPFTEDSPANAPDMLKEREVNAPRVFDHTDVFDGVVLRPTNVYGYSSSYYAMLLEWAEAAADAGDGVLTVPGLGGDVIVQALHVDDCAEAYVALAEHADRAAVAGQIFNISAHRYETIREVSKALAQEYGLGSGSSMDGDDGVAYVPASSSPPRDMPVGLHFIFSFSQWIGSDKIRRLTGWSDRRELFSESLHVYRLAYEAERAASNDNVETVRRRFTSKIGSTAGNKS